MYGLLDCNNFYASCERAFNPSARNKPVVVLSNNDGCVIARSQEAKKLGIPMAAAAFEYKDIFALHNVQIFSANFVLYGDMSRRVMTTLYEICPDIEIYSIDEAFMHFENFRQDPIELSRSIRKKILQSTSIPVSIGLAPTKTLAKLCNHIAKKNSPQSPLYQRGEEQSEGVCSWEMIKDKDAILKKFPVEEIWGVGYRGAKRLNALGIYTVYDLKTSNPAFVRANFSVMTERVILELNGIPCYGVHTESEPKKGIVSSRTFGRSVTALSDVREAVSTFTAIAAQKLRDQGSAAMGIAIWLRPSKHKAYDFQFFKYKSVALPTASCYTPDLIKAALGALDEIYEKGLEYKKAAVMLWGIVPWQDVQLNVFENDYPYAKFNSLMSAVDTLNNELGHEYVKYGSMGVKKRWGARQEKRSPRYTTNWDELLVVK